MGDAGQGPGDVAGVEHGAAGVRARSRRVLRLGAGTSCRTSFSASRDGSLKDVDRRRPYQPRGPGARPDIDPTAGLGTIGSGHGDRRGGR